MAETKLLPARQEHEPEPKPTPVLPEWFDAYKAGNILIPQTIYGIYPLVGRAVTQSLRSEAVDLSYVARSRLTRSQFNKLRDAAVRAHRAHGIRVMPNGFAQSGEKEFSANSWLNGQWDETKRSVVRALVYFCADIDPHSMEYDDIVRSPANELAYSLSFDTNIGEELWQKDIQDFSSSSEYRAALPIVSAFYEAVAQALDTDLAQELAKRRRDLFNKTKFPNGRDRDDMWYYNHYLAKLMLDRIMVPAKRHQVNLHRVNGFLKVITGLPIEDVTRFQWDKI